jgi:lipopolysaccharide transport system permease protein
MAKNKLDNEHWDLIVRPKGSLFDLKLREVIKYSDLLFLLVRRDFTAQFKQTVLGPVLLFVQPLAITFTYAFIFGSIANIGTGGTPRVLFYLSGLTLWTYFADCLNKTSSTFVSNAGMFGKVYFPRLIIPLSVIFSNLIKLGAQFLLFIIIWFYYYFTTDVLHPNLNYIYLVPLLVILMAGLGLGFGIFISSVTTKYRDLTFFVGFGIQLLMYVSSVIIPLERFPKNIQGYVLLNPMCSIIETFKYIFLGSGYFNWYYLLYCFIFMFLLLLLSAIVFNKAEKSFMDTV